MKRTFLFLVSLFATFSINAQDLTATAIVQDQTCVYGSINITPSGGTGDYVFAVISTNQIVFELEFSSNQFFSLPAGTYDYYVRDNSGEVGFSQFGDTIEILDIGGVDFNHSEIAPVCADGGGSSVVEILNGFAPYTVDIIGSSDVLFSTTFSDQIITLTDLNFDEEALSIEVTDDNGCKAIHSFSIPDATVAPIVSSASVSQPYTCNSTAQITFMQATGGTPPYQYGINGFYSNQLIMNNLLSGTYELSVRDANGCEVSLPEIVIEEDPFTEVDFFSEVSYNCDGTANITILPTSATIDTSEYIYLLNGDVSQGGASNVFTNVSSGMYLIVVENGLGCSTNVNVLVEDGQEMKGEILEISDSQCSGSNNGSITMQAFNFDQFVDQYQVSADGGSTWSTTSDNPYVFEGLEAGSHEIRIRQIVDLGDPNNPSTLSFDCEILVETIDITEPEQLSLTAEVNNIVCSGEESGEIFVDGFGGVPPYEFSLTDAVTGTIVSDWQSSSTFSGLPAGDFQVSIRDSRLCTACGCATNPFVNGSIEDATFVPINSFRIVDESEIAGWETNAPDSKLEVWGTSFQAGRPAYDGNYFIELNANNSVIDQALYQEFCTREGDVIQWQVAHRGRTGVDVAEIRIGESIASAVRQDVADINGNITPNMTTGATGGDDPVNKPGWKLYKGTYTVPPGQSSTVISFEAVSSSIGNLAVGNFLDAISIEVVSATCSAVAVTIPDNINQLIVGITTTSNTIIAQGIGGTPPYQYSIDGGTTYQEDNVFSNLITGLAYDVYVIDANGCVAMNDAYLQDSELSSTVSIITDVNCTNANSGVIEVQAFGGEAPYIFQIFDSGSFFSEIISENDLATFSSLAAGEYVVSVIDSTDHAIESVLVLNEPAEILINYSFENPTCNGEADGSIVVEAIGGIGNYLYAIGDQTTFQTSNIFTGLSAGSYTIFVQDENGCIATAQAILDEPDLVTINSITAIPSGNEASGNIVVGATGGVGNYSFSIDEFNFSISNRFFDLQAGIYNIIASDANACTSIPVEVTIVSLDIDNSVSEDILGVLSASFTDAIAYQWINVDTGERIPGATSAFFTPTENGRYQVEMTIADATTISAKGIQTVTANQTVLSPIIVYESAVLSTTDIEKTFSVYPNPSKDFITLPNVLINKEFKIYNNIGQEVIKGKINTTRLALTNLSSGLYYFKVASYEAVQFIKEE